MTHGFPLTCLLILLCLFLLGWTEPIDTNLHIPFITNEGQIHDRVAFYANIMKGAAFITKRGEILYSLEQKVGKKNNRLVLQEEFMGGRLTKVLGEDPSNTRISCFKGQDPSNWKSDIPAFNQVNLGEVYPRIEIKLRAYGNNVEKLFFIKPGGCPNEIRVRVGRAETISINHAGELLVETPSGVVSFTKPVAFQNANGKKMVEVQYEAYGNEYGFKTGEYDVNSTLIIDPMLSSTLLGGSSADGTWRGAPMVLGSDGNAYVAGHTSSPDFPATPNAFNDNFNGGGSDIFVSKLSKDLKTLISSTFLGGGKKEEYPSLALDSSGNVFVAGQTSSTNFPVTPGAYDTSFNGGFFDSFVSKLDHSLTNLVASTYLGGKQAELGYSKGAAIDKNDNIYVMGGTESPDFPTTQGALQNSYSGEGDIFLSRFNNTLTTLICSTFLGGNKEDAVAALALDKNGDVFAAGSTSSPDFPVTPNAFDTSYSGGYCDIFISKLNPDLKGKS